ncbi:hypothetical protein M0804_015556 [Polistes exclamans]|nr:hypothetical protein M0804_015556 [Polistes exclamans]
MTVIHQAKCSFHSDVAGYYGYRHQKMILQLTRKRNLREEVGEEAQVLIKSVTEMNGLIQKGISQVLYPLRVSPAPKQLTRNFGFVQKQKSFMHFSLQTKYFSTSMNKQTSMLLNAQPFLNGTSKWTLTNKNELKRLFGLLIWMGMVNLPSLRLYWSQDPLFSQTFPRSVMSRGRFEILMRMLHFADNEAAVANNRLSKIKFIIDELNTNFQKYYDPPEDKKDVMVLSTKHSSEMINGKTKRGFCYKPQIIAEYNTAKTSIDLSDQMSAYSRSLEENTKMV